MSHEGVVIKFNALKGFGFVKSNSTESDVFLGKGNLGGYTVSEGDKVRFDMETSTKGMKATNVQVLQQRTTNQFFGEVKSFSAHKGFGFISSPALTSAGDIFFMQKDVYSPVDKGSQVVFKVAQEDRGWVAKEVSLVDGKSSYAGGYGMDMYAMSSPWGYGGGGWWDGGMGYKSWGSSGGGGPVYASGKEEIYFGQLKQLHQDKSWGHISCAATYKMYGKDVFVRLDGLPYSFEKDDTLCFKAQLSVRGLQAENVKKVEDHSDLRVFHGEVHSYDESKGFGFVHCEDTKPTYDSENFFTHKRNNSQECQKIKVGDKVTFKVDISYGRACAILESVTQGAPVTVPVAQASAPVAQATAPVAQATASAAQASSGPRSWLGEEM
mmetsp:Transcript_52584/g.94400  ORF Transcript_52584/g.94400 Transcript_52584/m.94400 type:complete len:381 (-) Transcript_52584:62-1204(-)